MTQPIPRDAIYRRRVFDADQRAIKRRCASMTGFKSFATAAVTLAGIELAHRVRKKQFRMKQRYRQFGKRTLKEGLGSRMIG